MSDPVVAWVVRDSTGQFVGAVGAQDGCKIIIDMVKNSPTYDPPFTYELELLD